jgi:uncharacterized protein (DUF1499 family)
VADAKPRRYNPAMMNAPTMGPLLVALAAILLPAAGIGHRFGRWRFRTGVALVALAAVLAGLGTALCLIALPELRSRELSAMWPAIVGAVVGLAVLSVPLRRFILRLWLPAIHDVSTDLDDPPRFVAILQHRTGAPNPPEHGGVAVTERQRRAYPEIVPLDLELPTDAAFAAVQAAAEELGWTVVAQDPAAGDLEATATTLWFGFKDDVVVRVREHEHGSRVDVRSASRVGTSDLGTNAARIRAFLRLVSGGP